MDLAPILVALFAHRYAAGGAAVCALFVTLLSDRVRIFPTWLSPWRTPLGTFAGIAGAALDAVSNGVSIQNVAIAAASTGLPTLIAECMALLMRKTPPLPMFLLCLTLGACVGTPPAKTPFGPSWLEKAILIEQQSSAIVAALKAAADFYMATAGVPDSTKETIAKAFTDFSFAEAALSALTYGGEYVAQKDYDAASASAQTAYRSLLGLLKTLGIVRPQSAPDTLAVMRDGIVIGGVPLLLTERVVLR